MSKQVYFTVTTGVNTAPVRYDASVLYANVAKHGPEYMPYQYWYRVC